ncbi:MAG TPA: DinB family protein [Candidatus Saccharimonadales bacterium]|nr:DinB family protein [Candidatus Saccharimonadales bacterium]
MSLIPLLLTEFDQEMQNTQKTLERVPADKWDWKPHDKSGNLGWLAGHVATLPRFVVPVVAESKMDISGYPSPKVNHPSELLQAFAKSREDARQALTTLKDDRLNETWTLTWEGKEIFSMPRYHVLRVMCFNHSVHHRAQLTVYLRLLDVAVPAIYGPSADEQF